MKRTYQEAVNITVGWWIEKTFHTPNNQNNGDNDDGTAGPMSAMMNRLVSPVLQKIKPVQIELFKVKLTELLLNGSGDDRYSNQLEVDYDPNIILADACRFAEIPPLVLPCKSFTYIDSDNTVNGKYQYGGQWFKI